MKLTSRMQAFCFECFSWPSQILAMASRMNKRALRLVHVPSRTIFANWPTPRTPLHYVHSLAFSPGGGFLAVGTAQGRALLYRLKHYPAA
jgi:U3 small nucleolar RNA-associated protein 18